MTSIHLLLLSVFLIPLMQTAYSQSSMNQSGGPIVNQPAGTDNPVNKPGDRFGLIEDTPNYNKYIPNTGPSSDNALIGPAQPSNGAAGGGSTSSSSSPSNASNPIGGALENTTKTISETIGKGISGILNLGNSSSK